MCLAANPASVPYCFSRPPKVVEGRRPVAGSLVGAAIAGQAAPGRRSRTPPPGLAKLTKKGEKGRPAAGQAGQAGGPAGPIAPPAGPGLGAAGSRGAALAALRGSLAAAALPKAALEDFHRTVTRPP